PQGFQHNPGELSALGFAIRRQGFQGCFGKRALVPHVVNEGGSAAQSLLESGRKLADNRWVLQIVSVEDSYGQTSAFNSNGGEVAIVQFLCAKTAAFHDDLPEALCGTSRSAADRLPIGRQQHGLGEAVG